MRNRGREPACQSQLLAFSERLFHLHLLGYIPDEATGMNKLPFLPQPIGMDPDIFDRSIFAFEFRWIIVDVFTTYQLFPKLVEDLLIQVKIGKLMVHIFFGRISQKS